MFVVDPLPRITERVVLRRLQVADLEAFQSYRQDPEVGRYQSWEMKSDFAAKSFLANMSTVALFQPGQWSQIAIAHRSTDTLIGDIGVCVAENKDEAEIGVSLSRLSQGQGFASEAVRETIRLVFEQSEVNRIVGITDVRNRPSVRLLERVGMTQTETLYSTFKGEPCTEYVFVISRPSK